MTYKYDHRVAAEGEIDLSHLVRVGEQAHSYFHTGFASIELAESALNTLRVELVKLIPRGHSPMHGRPQSGDRVRSVYEYVTHLLDSLESLKPRNLSRLNEEFKELSEFIAGKV